MMSYMYLFSLNTLFYCEFAFSASVRDSCRATPSLTVSWILFSRI